MKKAISILKNKAVIIGVLWGLTLAVTGNIFYKIEKIQSPVVFTYRPAIIWKGSGSIKNNQQTGKIGAFVPQTVNAKEEVKSDLIQEQIDMSDIEIARYIKSKAWKYEDAIRLAKSENYWNLTKSFSCSRSHTNKDGSIDIGIFQINSIHTSDLKKKGMTMDDMKDCKKNIDYAFGMWSDQGGFQAWSAWNNGSYINHSIIEL